jgi:hypothetical protein
MKIKYLTICKIINSLNIIILLLMMGVMLNAKLINLRLSEEVSYMKIKIEEQEDNFKVINLQLAVLTQPDSLISLYKSYYNLEYVPIISKVTQVKTVDKLVSYFSNTKRYSRL